MGPLGERWGCGVSPHLGSPCRRWGPETSGPLSPGVSPRPPLPRAPLRPGRCARPRRMGVGSEAGEGDPGRDRSLRLGPPRPGGDWDQVPSLAAFGMGVGRGWAGEPPGVCHPASPLPALHSQLAQAGRRRGSPPSTLKLKFRAGGGSGTCRRAGTPNWQALCADSLPVVSVLTHPASWSVLRPILRTRGSGGINHLPKPGPCEGPAEN